jgi:multisubunit Na+/H+ antiporter MnhE subunit
MVFLKLKCIIGDFYRNSKWKKLYVFIVLLLLILYVILVLTKFIAKCISLKNIKVQVLLITFKFELLHDVGNVLMSTLWTIMPIGDNITPLNDCLILNILDTFINLV